MHGGTWCLLHPWGLKESDRTEQLRSHFLSFPWAPLLAQPQLCLQILGSTRAQSSALLFLTEQPEKSLKNKPKVFLWLKAYKWPRMKSKPFI